MSSLPFRPPAAFALARSCAEPIAVFETAEQLASAIVQRCGARPNRVLSKCACTARDPQGEAALAVYATDDKGERIAFIGYAFGFDHDGEVLSALLRGATALQAEAA